VVRVNRIRVLKRDGTIERFDPHKLRGCLLRVLPVGDGRVYVSGALSAAVRQHILRREPRCVSSAAILEMALAALRAANLTAAAERLEREHTARSEMRTKLTVSCRDGGLMAWSKDWVVRFAEERWSLGRTAARILAGRVEHQLMRRSARRVERKKVINMLARLVSAYGLATSSPAGAGARPGWSL